jgi:cytidylate kinase
MSWELKLYLTNVVIELHKKADKEGDPKLRQLAEELNEVINGALAKQ